MQQTIISYWMGELPLQQTSLLLYINERTLRYGKAIEHINRSHFLTGVKDKQGRVLHNGVNVAHPTLWKYIKAVEENGLVRVVHQPRNRRGNGYSLALEEIMKPVYDSKLQTSSKSRVKGRRKRRITPGK